MNTPSSEGSTYTRGGSSKKLPPPPLVLQIMEMGFSRKSVELAMKTVSTPAGTKQNAEQIIQWILEHPDQFPPLQGRRLTRSRARDFDADSDSESISSDTVEGSTGSSLPETQPVLCLKVKLKVPFNNLSFYFRQSMRVGMILKAPTSMQCTFVD